MKNSKHPLETELDKIFLDHPEGNEAKAFLVNFGLYCHMIDDLIDGEVENKPEQFAATLMLATNIYSCAFYSNHQQQLYHAVHLIHHMYFDSVQMERSNVLWKREQADTLKSAGIQMTMTIIEILGGGSKRRELAQLVYEHSYKAQHDEAGNPLP